jgi:hypothetical protein
MAKIKAEDREFHTVQDILGHLTEIWNDLTFEDVQSAFLEWHIRLNRVVENGSAILNRVKRMELYSADIPKASYRQDFSDNLHIRPAPILTEIGRSQDLSYPLYVSIGRGMRSHDAKHAMIDVTVQKSPNANSMRCHKSPW